MRTIGIVRVVFGLLVKKSPLRNHSGLIFIQRVFYNSFGSRLKAITPLLVVELRQSEGLPSGVPYSNKKEKKGYHKLQKKE